MTEAGDTAAAGGGPPAALSVIDDQIAAFRQDLNDAKEAIKAIYIAREATPPVPLPKYRTEEEQDRALDRLEAKEERLLRILDNLTSQRAQAQAQAGAAQAGAGAGSDDGGAAAAVGLDAGAGAHFTEMKEMLRQLLDNKTGSKWKTISDANTEVWNIMRRKTGLEVMLYTAPLAVEPRRATIEPFGWDDRVEKAQADRYMPYLKALISPQDRSFELLDGNQHCSLNVDGVADILGYDFHGKPDAVLILRGSRLSPQTALRVVFELKKELNAAAHYQAMVTLVLANYHSSRLKPIVILTDLRGDYAFYWLDGRTLHYIELDRDSAKLAWGFFDAILQSERTDLAAGVVPHEGLEAPPPVKRQRLVFESSDTQDVANVDDLTGLLEPSELRAYTLAQFIQSLHGRPAVAAACNAYASMYV